MVVTAWTKIYPTGTYPMNRLNINEPLPMSALSSAGTLPMSALTAGLTVWVWPVPA